MQEKIVLTVGEEKKIKTGFLGSHTVVYCGMPCENVFSIGIRESHGHQGYAMNLFFPKNSRTIKVRETEFTVFDVTPEKLTLEQVIRRAP
jgi:hypothetical protein